MTDRSQMGANVVGTIVGIKIGDSENYDGNDTDYKIKLDRTIRVSTISYTNCSPKPHPDRPFSIERHVILSV